MKKISRRIVRVLLILIAAFLVLWLLVFINSKIRFRRDKAFLEEKGYCNLVSAGDYSVNVLIYGNENGKHRIIAMAGQGIPDSCITMRRMTAALESDNQVIFLDRAGYGISDDTAQEMTVENIVAAYRTALKNAGIEAPYVLMPHSIGGVYATIGRVNTPMKSKLLRSLTAQSWKRYPLRNRTMIIPRRCVSITGSLRQVSAEREICC